MADRSNPALLVAALVGLAAALGGGVYLLSGPKTPAQQNPEPDLPKASPEALGRAVFKQWSCGSCHLEQDSDTGSSLKGLVGQTVELADGKKLVIDEAYLRESILTPGAKVRKGFDPVMPEYKGRIKDDELDKLIAYLLVRK